MAATILLLGLMAQIMSPGESTCLGFINDSLLPLNVYIAGTREEGYESFSASAGFVYLNGPGVPTLRPGDLYRVVRPEGRISNPETRSALGIYYRQLGTVRIERSGTGSAIGVVVVSCHPIAKGDILLPVKAIAPPKFEGILSDKLTPFPETGVRSAIVLGENDLKELATGHFCFIAAGSREGVKAGDRFTVYRFQPPFDRRDMSVLGTQSYVEYEKVRTGAYRAEVEQKLASRELPPRVLGDLIIVDASDTTAIGRIINSFGEIHPGDVVVRR